MSIDFPHEPAGFTALTTNAWDAICSTGWSAGPGGVCASVSGGCTIVTDSGAGTLSNPNVLNLEWHHNTTGGNDIAYNFPTPASDLFMGFIHKTSNPYLGYTNNHEKLFYLNDYATGSLFWFELQPDSIDTDTNRVRVEYESHAAGGTSFAQRADGAPIVTKGVWHKFEVRLRCSSAVNVNDSLIQVWVDGVSHLTLTNATVPHFSAFDVGPTWDTPQGDPTRVDHQWWDHTYISASGGTPPDTTPPAIPTGVTVT